MKLAQPAFLRPLVAKHRAGVPQSLRLIEQQTVLLARAYATRRAFRSQRQAIAIAIDERIHFFFDDVCDFADRAFEQLGLFENRKTYFLIAVSAEQLLGSAFDILP